MSQIDKLLIRAFHGDDTPANETRQNAAEPSPSGIASPAAREQSPPSQVDVNPALLQSFTNMDACPTFFTFATSHALVTDQPISYAAPAPRSEPMTDRSTPMLRVANTPDLADESLSHSTSQGHGIPPVNPDSGVPTERLQVPRFEVVRPPDEDTIDVASQGETSPIQSVTEPVGSNPAWEVDRLNWPTVVTDLLQVASGPVQHFVHWLEEILGPGSAVAVTSCHRGEGRSTVACVLARQAAQAGLRVALVDADRHQPRLASSLGLLAQNGWSESPQEPDQFSIHSIEDFLTVVPLAESPSSPEGWQPCTLVKRLLEGYDLVVLDAPPLSELHGEWKHGAANGLRWIVVRDPRMTNELDLTRAQMQIRAEGLAMLGIAENFAA